METHEIRQRFLDHFEKAGTPGAASASLVSDDPTVLFTIAGMAADQAVLPGPGDPAGVCG